MDTNWQISEAIAYYRGQGAPGNQQALVSLLRETQRENGGVIPEWCVSEIALAYGIKETFLQAVIKRIPSLRAEQAPHRLELCGGPNCCRKNGGKLAKFVETTYGVQNGGVSKTGGFSYHVAGCMKNCGKGPNLKWDGKLYAGGDEALVRVLVSGEKKS